MTDEKLKRVRLWQKETHKLIDEEHQDNKYRKCRMHTKGAKNCEQCKNEMSKGECK